LNVDRRQADVHDRDDLVEDALRPQVTNRWNDASKRWPAPLSRNEPEVLPIERRPVKCR
jgi:hypothetical protein